MLSIAVVPIALFKNGLRIATLSALSVYVNPAFLYGNLHHRGGIVFFVLALIPMVLLLKLLQKNEAAEFCCSRSPWNSFFAEWSSSQKQYLMETL